jgi:hypothetical protein
METGKHAGWLENMSKFDLHEGVIISDVCHLLKNQLYSDFARPHCTAGCIQLYSAMYQ